MTETIKPPKGNPKQISSQQMSIITKLTLLRLPTGHPPLQVGQNLTGIVLKSLVAGETRIQLNTGEIFFESEVSLKIGTKVLIRVISGEDQPQVLLQKYPSQTRNGSLPKSTAHMDSEELYHTNARLGSGDIASSAFHPTNSPPVNLSGLLANGKLFSGQVSGPPQTEPLHTKHSPKPQFTSTHNNVPKVPMGTTQPPFLIGTSLTIQLISFSKSEGGIQSPLTSRETPFGSAGTKLIGTVTNVTPDGRPIINTPVATITLEIKSSIPIGTRLTMVASVLSEPNKRPTLATISTLGNWQLLQDAMQIIRQADPITHSSLIRKIPTPGAQLTASMLLFLYTMKNGGLSRFLGEGASRILKADENIWKFLQEDVGPASRQAPDRANSDWRTFMIPFSTPAGLQQFRLSVRPDDEPDGTNSGKDPIFRFIVEAILEKLGQIQLEGRVQNKVIELILYSQNTVPDELRLGVNTIYTNTLSALGFAGTLSYRQVESLDEMPQGTASTARRGISV